MSEPGSEKDRPAGSTPEAWYRLGGEAVRARLGSSREGLSAEEAARRLATHVPNALAETSGPSHRKPREGMQ